MKQPELTEQILGMYIGRPCTINESNNEEIFSHGVFYNWRNGSYKSITPHLRRLESITPQEVNELYEIELTSLGNYVVKPVCIGSPQYWLYLLSRGFDLFGLIDAGLAKEVSE